MILATRLSLLGLLAIFIGCAANGCPTDEEIQAIFNEHEDSFNKFAAMANEEEKRCDIRYDGSYDKTAINRDRAEEYLQLLEDMELKGAYVNWTQNGKGLLLFISPKGWVDGAVWKSMRYHKVPAVHEDALGKKRKYPIYKRLGDNWQLQLLDIGGAE